MKPIRPVRFNVSAGTGDCMRYRLDAVMEGSGTKLAFLKGTYEVLIQYPT